MTHIVQDQDPLPICKFCKGRPVLNASAWTSTTQKVYAQCPACGAQPPEPGATPTFEVVSELSYDAASDELSRSAFGGGDRE